MKLSTNKTVAPSEIGEIRLDYKDANEILEFYKKVGKSYENTSFVDVVTEYLEQEPVAAK